VYIDPALARCALSHDPLRSAVFPTIVLGTEQAIVSSLMATASCLSDDRIPAEVDQSPVGRTQLGDVRSLKFR
jgi:hypothetical protein